jgi:ATP-dependent Lon protease
MARSTKSVAIASELPVLPLRDGALFPASPTKVAVGRPQSAAAVLRCVDTPGRHLLALAQVDESVDEPEGSDFYAIGCVAEALGVKARPDAGFDLDLVGVARARVLTMRDRAPILAAIECIDEPPDADPPIHPIAAARLRSCAIQVARGCLGDSSWGASRRVDALARPGRLADFILGFLMMPVADHQAWLEEVDVRARVDFVLAPDPGLRLKVVARRTWLARAWDALTGDSDEP